MIAITIAAVLIVAWLTASVTLASSAPPRKLIDRGAQSPSFLRQRSTLNAELLGIDSRQFEVLRMISVMVLAISALVLVAALSGSLHYVAASMPVAWLVGWNTPTLLIHCWVRRERRRLMSELPVLLRCIAYELQSLTPDTAVFNVVKRNGDDTFEFFQNLAEKTEATTALQFWDELYNDAIKYDMPRMAHIALEAKQRELASVYMHDPSRIQDLMLDQANRCESIALGRRGTATQLV